MVRHGVLPMRILFLHQNFPGQFIHVAVALKQQAAHSLIAVVPSTNERPPLITTKVYEFDPRKARTTLSLAGHYTERVGRGLAVAVALRSLQREGFQPDLVVGHGGWGETLFVHDVWPHCPILLHAEFFYSTTGSDANFDPEFASGDELLAMRIRARNSAMALALLDAERAVAPTEWQASRFPDILRPKITVAHEGINTKLLRPSSTAAVRLRRSNLTFKSGEEVITFVNRNLEPHRGFHVFMRALPSMLAKRPNARAVIVGGDETSYGPPPANGRTWKEVLLDEVKGRLDLRRVHFVGRVPHSTLVQLLQVSAAHVYLTYPFVLSWSMLDAMSAGALVIGSRTPPVEEVIENGKNGILRDFFDVDGLADAVVDALSRPERYRGIREAARKTVVDRYDLKRICIPAWLSLLGETAGARPQV